METLVATVLIVIIFTVSSLLLNAMLSNNLKGRDHHITERLNQLYYKYQHQSLMLPYFESSEGWEFSVTTEIREGILLVILKAENPLINKSYSKTATDGL